MKEVVHTAATGKQTRPRFFFVVSPPCFHAKLFRCSNSWFCTPVVGARFSRGGLQYGRQGGREACVVIPSRSRWGRSCECSRRSIPTDATVGQSTWDAWVIHGRVGPICHRIPSVCGRGRDVRVVCFKRFPFENVSPRLRRELRGWQDDYIASGESSALSVKTLDRVDL